LLRSLICVLLLPLHLLAQQDVALFDDTIVHDIRLTIDPAAWQTLRDNFEKDDYYHSDFSWKGTSLQNIGIKSRGSGSRSPFKPNLTVKFNKFQKQKFLAHNTILLKANNQDGSMMREYLTFALARRLGLPAPREAPARLYVNGAFFGYYTIVEDIDNDFLTRVFGESSGYLYDFNPILDYHFDYLGEDPAKYGLLFEPKSHEDAPEFPKLYEMLRVIGQSSDEEFATVGPTYVDVAGFLRLLAVESYVADLDGFLSDVWGMNNLYLYRPENSRQFRFLAWDTDFTFGWAGRPIFQNMDRNELTRRAMAVPSLRQVYIETMLQAATIAGGEGGWLRREVDRLEVLIGSDARRDPNKQCWRSGLMVACNADDFEREVAVVRAFAVERYSTLVPQLEAMLVSATPKMSTGGVVNAATYTLGLVPGSLASVYGSSMARTGESAETWPLPLTLADVEVSVNGVTAPLLFVSPLQINFQVPWNLPVGDATVDVSLDGVRALPLSAPLLHASPGIFAAAHAADFSLVSAAKPAIPGEMLSLFGTGLGPVSPEVRDGESASLDVLSRTLETVTATLSGTPVEVTFSGLAPGLAGVYQVNLRLPATLPTTVDGTLVINVAGSSSPAFRLPLR